METQEVTALFTLMDNAKQHMNSKKYQNASIYYNDVLKKFDSALEKVQTQNDVEKLIKQIKAPAHKNLSLCYFKLNQHKMNVNQCEEALKLQPNNLKILYRIGKSLTSLKRYSEAENFLKRGFANDPHEQQILKALEELELAKQKSCNNEESTLKKLVSFFCYWPLLILNAILSRIFTFLGNNNLEKKQN